MTGHQSQLQDEKRSLFATRSGRAGAPWLRLASVSLLALGAAGAWAQGPGVAPPSPQEQVEALQLQTVTLPTLSPAEMSAEDAALLNAREADVSKAAAFYGFDISEAKWSYQQIVCRTLPEHMFLSFSDDPSSDAPSRFVAIVPRQAHDHEPVEIVTSFARGLFPFRAAWKREGSFQTFNKVVLADRGDHAVMPNSHWLNLGMCFVALTGALPQVAVPVDNVAASEALAKRRGITPIIRVGEHGAAEVAFSDVARASKTANWTLTFDRDGKLKKVARTEDGPLKVQTSPPPAAAPPIVPE